MLVDTHAHVNFKAFAHDADAVINRALAEEVWVVNVGTQFDTSKAAVMMAETPISSAPIVRAGGRVGVYAVVGLHPVHTYSQHLDEEETSFFSREERFDYETYRQLARSPKVVGIGECGLDYFRLKIEDSGFKIDELKQLQKDAFIKQIRLAGELNKALVIHGRPSAGSQDAYLDILKILDSEITNPNSKTRFEIHSFTGSPEIVQEFLKRGAYVGLNGIITFDRTGNMAKVVKSIPLDRIVLETDAPYLAPLPHRGGRNEPVYVKSVAKKIAEIKRMSFEEVASQTSGNAKKLFDLA